MRGDGFIRPFGNCRLFAAVAVVVGLTVFLTIGFAPPAQALPSFARQTVLKWQEYPVALTMLQTWHSPTWYAMSSSSVQVSPCTGRELVFGYQRVTCDTKNHVRLRLGDKLEGRKTTFLSMRNHAQRESCTGICSQNASNAKLEFFYH